MYWNFNWMPARASTWNVLMCRYYRNRLWAQAGMYCIFDAMLAEASNILEFRQLF